MLSDDVTIPKRKCKAVALYLSCSAEEAGVLSLLCFVWKLRDSSLFYLAQTSHYSIFRKVVSLIVSCLTCLPPALRGELILSLPDSVFSFFLFFPGLSFLYWTVGVGEMMAQQ